MKKINANDLKQQITILHYDNKKDESYGWENIVIISDNCWAFIDSIAGRDGYHGEKLGGSMANNQGYIQKQRAKYRVIVRVDVDLSKAIGFRWQINGESKTLMISHQPFLVQDGDYQCCITVEEESK